MRSSLRSPVTVGRSFTVCVAALSLALLATAAPAGAVVSSTLDQTFQTNGAVTAMVQSGNRVFVGGSFTRAGMPTPFGADFGQADGSASAAFPAPNQSVNAIVSDGAGGWYVGGNFTALGSVARNRLAHLLANGTVDPNFNPSVNNNQVKALVLSGGTLYAGGSFTSVGSPAVTRNRIAAFDASSGALTGFDPNIANNVNALAVSGSTLYAGGDFTTVNATTTRNHLAAFDTAGTGTATSFDPNLDNGVFALAASATTVYAGGTFATVNGATPRSGIAAFDAGGTATSFDPNVNGGSVFALALTTGVLYAGGTFSTVNAATTRNNVAAFDTTGTGTATSFDPNVPDALINALALSGNALYAAGSFTKVNGSVARNNFAAFDTTTTGTATSFDPNVDNTVLALAATGTRVYAGGSFLFAGAATIHSELAAVKPDGTLDPGFNANVSGGGIRSLTVSGARLFAGGDFTTVDASTTRNRLAAFDTTTGAVDAGFDPNVDATVNALVVAGSKLYASGAFTKVNGSLVANRNHVAAFDTTTGVMDATFDPSVNSSVTALALTGGKLYLGGGFATLNVPTVARNNLAAVDPVTGTADPTFNPNVNGAVNALQVSGSRLYAGGAFTVVNGATVAAGGTARNRLAAVDLSTGTVDPTFNPNVNNTISALALSGSTLYAGGAFTTVNGATARNRLAAFDTSGAGTVDPTFNPNMSSTVSALLTTGAQLYAGGSFQLVGGTIAQRFFARFSSPAPAVVTGTASSITTSAASLAGTVNPNGSSTSYVFEYGPSLSFGSITTPDVAGSGSGVTAVTGSLTGLTSNTTYYYRLVATSAAGTAFGTVMSFNTGGTPQKPVVTTLAASSVTAATAVLNGQVDPEGQQTSYTLEYGTSTGFGSITPVVALDAAIADEPVSAAIGGLTANTTYYYRAVATNATGTTFGTVHSFNSGGAPLAPVAVTLPATSVGSTSATLPGQVNPEGQQTAYTVEYGTSLGFGTISPVVALDAAIALEPVGATITGLTPGTVYLYRVVATNATGMSAGVVRSFTTSAVAARSWLRNVHLKSSGWK